MKTRLPFLFLSAFVLLAILGCKSRERTTTGIANERGMITGNMTTDPKPERLTMKDVREKAGTIIPDW